MSAPYDDTLRARVIGAVEQGASARSAGARFDIGVATSIRWVRQWRETGEVNHQPQRRRVSALEAHTGWLIAVREAEPELRLVDIAARLEAEQAVRTDKTALSRFYRKAGITFKSQEGSENDPVNRFPRRTLFATEQDRGDVALARWLWRRGQKDLDPARLVFIDEMGAATYMACRHGWARRGQKYVAKSPHGHWKTSTFVAGLRHDRIIAPMVIDCPMNREIFTVYVNQCLAPALSPGDIVVMDNLSSHKGEVVAALIEARGAELLFLPPYSPDLNPIEQVFSKLKRGLRRAAKRTVETLRDEIGRQMDRFAPEECANYFRGAGY